MDTQCVAGHWYDRRTYTSCPDCYLHAEPDMVNSPPHYTGDIECIDAIRAALGEDGFVAFCRGNSIKYLWRAGRKGEAVQDLAKAAWYSRMASGDDPRESK